MKLPSVALVGIAASARVRPLPVDAAPTAGPYNMHDESSPGGQGYLRSLQRASSASWPQCGTVNDCRAGELVD